MKNNYRIGLDIGVASVGWSVFLHDENGEPDRLLARGVRVFEAAENPKDGESLAAQRRGARSVRRSLRRRKHRLERIKHLIVENLGLSETELDNLFEYPSCDIYSIRFEALSRKLTNQEFSRLLVHLAKKRGFKSNRKNAKGEGDEGKLLTATAKTKTAMEEKGYRTVGEYLFKECVEKGRPTRNKGGDYSLTFFRDLTDKEVDIIFDSQRKLGSTVATKSLEEKYKSILLSQRNFDVGPGKGSIWGWGEGSMIEKMVGICTFENKKNGKETDELRLAKGSYSFERFMLVQKVNSLRLKEGLKETELTPSQRQKIIEFAYEKSEVKFNQLRKLLELGDYPENGEKPKYLFNFCRYKKLKDKDKDKDKDEGKNFYAENEKATFVKLKGYHDIKKVLGEDMPENDIELLDNIAYVYSFYKNDESIEKALVEKNIGGTIKEKLLKSNLNFSGVGSLSLKAINKILPHLETGVTYDKAAELAGYDFRNQNRGGERKNRLNFNDISDKIYSPVVKRAVSQSFKVINAIVREFGEPSVMFIELAREMAKNFTERGKLEKFNEKNREDNEKIIVELKDKGWLSPSGKDIVKYKLWRQQQGMCLYSLTQISIQDLKDDSATEIDHIIPYSMSYDNSRANMALVKKAENQNKRNEVAYNYIKRKGEDFLNKYEIWVKNHVWSKKKKDKLLCKSISEADIEGFKEKNLHDTKYATRLIASFVRDNLKFSEGTKFNNKVVTVNGQITSYLRKRLYFTNLEKDRSTDNHHAQDACFVAVCGQGMTQKISTFEKLNRDFIYQNGKYIHKDTGVVFDDKKQLRELQSVLSETFGKTLPPPYENFTKEMQMWFDINPNNDEYMQIRHENFTAYQTEEKIPPLFVSRMTNHKITGQAHQETIKRKIVETDEKGREQDYNIKKVSLDKLKLKNGEIENYYNPSSDRLLYEHLKDLLKQHGTIPVDLPVFKPRQTANGVVDGPPVKKVKLQEKTSSGVFLEKVGGSAANGSMIRIDVFSRDLCSKCVKILEKVSIKDFVRCTECSSSNRKKKYYFVPIYVADFKKEKLPNKSCKGLEMDSDMGFAFEFSLFAKDLIRIQSKGGLSAKSESKDKDGKIIKKSKVVAKDEPEFMYYTNSGITNEQINTIAHNKEYIIQSIGIQNLLVFEKWEVDILGNIKKAPFIPRDERTLFKGRKRDGLRK